MNREQFMSIFNRYFSDRKKCYHVTNPRGLFCAYCEFLLYVEKSRHKHRLPFPKWLKKNNIPDFGYKSPLSAVGYFFNDMKAACKGERFLDLVPSWREYVKNEPEGELFAQAEENVEPQHAEALHNMHEKLNAISSNVSDIALMLHTISEQQQRLIMLETSVLDILAREKLEARA